MPGTRLTDQSPDGPAGAGTQAVADPPGWSPPGSSPPEHLLLGVTHLVDDVGPLRRHWVRRQMTILLTLPLALVGGLLVTPVVMTVRGGFRDFFASGDAWTELLATILWTLVVPLGITTAGLAGAHLLGRLPRRGRRLTLSGPTMFLLIAPMAVPLTVTAVAFRILLQPDPDRGLATRYLGFLPGDSGWLGPRWLTISLILAFVWTWLGLAVVVFRTTLDRMRDIVTCRTPDGVEHLFPAEMEDALCRHGAVENCALTVNQARTKIVRAEVKLISDVENVYGWHKGHEVATALRRYLRDCGGRIATFRPPAVDEFRHPDPAGPPPTAADIREPAPWTPAFYRRYWAGGLAWVALAVFLLTAVMTARTLDLVLAMAPGSTLDDASALSVLHWQAAVEPDGGGMKDALATRWLAVLLGLVAVCLGALWTAGWQRPRWPHLRLQNLRDGPPTGPGATAADSRSRQEGAAGPDRSTRTWLERWLRRLGFTLLLFWWFPFLVLLMTSWHGPTLAATTAWWSEPSWFAFDSWTFDGETRSAMSSTLQISCIVAAVVLALASLFTKSLSGMSSLAERTLLMLMVALVLIPPQIVGSKIDDIFSWGPLNQVSGWQRLVLTHTAVALPLATMILYITGTDWFGATRSGVRERLREASLKNGSPSTRDRVTALIRAPWRTVFVEQPTVIAVAVLVFIQVWNDFVIGLLVGQDNIPLTVHLYGETRQLTSNLGPLAATSFLAALVPLVILAFAGPKLIEGLVGKDVRR